MTDGLRSDLTEAETKIEANRDAIAHIQEKDVQQDGRLDKLEECCEQAKAHFTQLDTKTDSTNTALTAEIDRAKAAELANGKLIAKNAAELATHATELADHEKRVTALEGDNATNKQEIADIKAKNTQQDAAIAGNTAAIQHLTEGAGEFVTKTDFNADQKRQDTTISDNTVAIQQLTKNLTDYFKSFTAQLPYKFSEQYAVLGVYYGEMGADSLTIKFVRPWFHTQTHNEMIARLATPTKFHVINVVRTDTSAESTDTVIRSTDEGVSIQASASASNPYVIVISISLPFASHSHVPYLVSCDSLNIEIAEAE